MCTDYKKQQLTTLELTVGWFLGLKVLKVNVTIQFPYVENE